MKKSGKELAGIMSQTDYFPIRGFHKGLPYKITEERGGKFLLSALSMAVGVGIVEKPVIFFGDNFQGIYVTSC